MNSARYFLLAAALLGAFAGVTRGQDSQKSAAPAPTQAQAPAATPDCIDPVQCATQCERGVAASCYKLGEMYDYGNSGVQKNTAQAIEFYVKACDKGKPDGCNGAGASIRASGLPADDVRAAELFKKGCAAGEPYSCGNLGTSYVQGRGVPKNPRQATEFLERACSGRAFFACVWLGAAFQNGDAGKKDEARAFALYGQACDGGVAVGCYDVAVLYVTGAGSAVGKDLKMAVPFYKRACTGGYATACDSLGTMYMQGNGVEKDPPRAIGLYQKACDGNDGYGCNNLALLYREGNGVELDLGKAAGLFQKGCDAGNASACADMGYAYSHGRGVAKDESRAVQLYQKACDGKNYTGCTNLGYMYRDGNGVAKDEARSISLFSMGCDAGASGGCFGLGYALDAGQGVAKDQVRSAKVYQKACDLHEPLACNNLGLQYREGRGVAKDEAHAVQLFKSACDAGEFNGCDNLGNAYEYARGVSMDESKAAEFYQKACQGSLASGCDDFKRLTQENRSLAHEAAPASTAPPASGHSGATTVATRGVELAKAGPKREQWALVVGISKYGPGVEGLRYARRDAESFREFLRSPAAGNFPDAHIMTLLDKDATNTNLRSGLRDFLGKAGKDDVVVIYFAGHGVADPNHVNALYLLTADTDPERLGGTAFDMQEIQGALQTTIVAERVMVFVDACHSGGITSQGNKRGGGNSGEMVNHYLALLARSEPSVATFSATYTNEQSVEGDQWGSGHGVFTYYLLEGLKGAADRDKDGVITLLELSDYVTARVKAATDDKQHPYFVPSGSWDANFPVAVVR